MAFSLSVVLQRTDAAEYRRPPPGAARHGDRPWTGSEWGLCVSPDLSDMGGYVRVHEMAANCVEMMVVCFTCCQQCSRPAISGPSNFPASNDPQSDPHSPLTESVTGSEVTPLEDEFQQPRLGMHRRRSARPGTIFYPMDPQAANSTVSHCILSLLAQLAPRAFVCGHPE
jgi:hypothetical protein